MRIRSHHPGILPVLPGFALLLLAALLAGCSREAAAPTGPGTTLVPFEANDDDTGTLRIPPRGGTALPTPGGVAELIAAHTVQIRWSPQEALWAQVKLNGRELAVVPSVRGFYQDATPRPAGTYVYELCFCRGGLSGPVVAYTVVVTDHVGPDLDGSPGQDDVTDATP